MLHFKRSVCKVLTNKIFQDLGVYFGNTHSIYINKTTSEATKLLGSIVRSCHGSNNTKYSLIILTLLNFCALFKAKLEAILESFDGLKTDQSKFYNVVFQSAWVLNSVVSIPDNSIL